MSTRFDLHAMMPESAAATRLHAFSGMTLGSFPRLLQALLQTKAACAEANVCSGEIPAAVAMRIKDACEALQSPVYLDWFFSDPLQGGGGIIINLNVNEALIALDATHQPRKPPLTWSQVNASQSTADVVATAGRIALIRSGHSLCATIERLCAALAEKEAEIGSQKTLARTCLQDAMPTIMGARLSGWRLAAARYHQRLLAAIGEMHAVWLGGTVIGDGLGASEAYREHILVTLRAASGLDLQIRPPLQDGAQNCDDLVNVAATVSGLASLLIRVGQTVRLLASGPKGGFGELSLTPMMRGSSFFQGKVNPTQEESLMQAGMQVVAWTSIASRVQEWGDADLNVWEPLATLNVLLSMTALERSLSHWTRGSLAGLQINSNRCQELAGMAPRF